MHKSKLQRIINVHEAYDKRKEKENYGIHGVEISMVLKGPEGATQFVIYTNRQLKSVQEELVNIYSLRGAAGKQLGKEDCDKLCSYHGPFTPGQEIQELIEWQKFLNELDADDFLLQTFFQPMPADLGYHSKAPMYDGHEPMRTMLRPPKFDVDNFKPGIWGDPIICPYLDDDVPCYYDGSSLNAKPLYQKLIAEGEEAVWAELEEYYNSLFLDQKIQ